MLRALTVCGDENASGAMCGNPEDDQAGTAVSIASAASYPERIVCLTEETTETLYLLGEERRIVGISGFTVRPPEARRDKPRVSAFTTASIDKILSLEPDLVLGFSDLQADIAATLVRLGVEVHVFNQRTVAGILRMIETLAAMVGCPEAGRALVLQLSANVAKVTDESRALSRRPRVYFEEWDRPMISGIGWVAELVRAAGGDDVFPEQATERLAKNRIISDEAEVVVRAPEIIIGSWCGKKFRPERVKARPGFNQIPAVEGGHLYEIKSPLILQPGPAALTDGLAALQRIIMGWAAVQG
jgi:iron complex transport system substrate-binding protein